MLDVRNIIGGVGVHMHIINLWPVQREFEGEPFSLIDQTVGLYVIVFMSHCSIRHALCTVTDCSTLH